MNKGKFKIERVVYKTTNLINGKIYIGKDSYNSEYYLGSGKYLKLAINKYGKENFKKEIIEFCFSHEHLKERERYWIKYYKSKECILYNIIEEGVGGDTISNNPNREAICEKIRKGINNSVKFKNYQSSNEKRILMSKYGKINNNWNKKKFQCVHCGIRSNAGNINRFHNTNCKLNPNITQEQLDKRKSWNKGLTKKTDKRIAQYGLKISHTKIFNKAA